MAMPNQKDVVVIGIDTGNRCMKTVSQIMVAGLYGSDQKPAVHDGNMIRYRGAYYMPSTDRAAYRRNKTEDDTYFILSLFAIVSELKLRGIPYGKDEVTPKVALAVGLPPAHMSKQKAAFREYFNRGVVQFEYNDIPAQIEIVDVFVFVQGLSAITSEQKLLKSQEVAYIVDIGGYTTDVICVERGVVNPNTVISEDAGMIHLYNHIKDELNLLYDDVPKEQQIDRLLSDPDYELEQGMKAVAEKTAAAYVDNLLRRLHEKGISLRLSKGFFVGGGASRLMKHIYLSSLVRDPVVISDIRANAIGYEALALRIMAKKK